MSFIEGSSSLCRLKIEKGSQNAVFLPLCCASEAIITILFSTPCPHLSKSRVTVEPLNKGHIGTRSFVLYREVSFI